MDYYAVKSDTWCSPDAQVFFLWPIINFPSQITFIYPNAI